MIKVLFLASWYPNRVDLFEGDFIERHAQSIGLNNKVFVIFVVKDPNITDNKVEIIKQVSGNIISYTAYYPSSKYKNIFFEKITSSWKRLTIFKNIFKKIVNEYGAIDIVHLNVLMNAGIFARWLKKKYHLPYVLSENWTGYYPEKKEGYLQQPAMYKLISKSIYRNCDLPLPVTEDLGKRMNKLMGEKEFRVIPNVVNTKLFYPDYEHTNSKIRFIHPSTLGYHKNINGILKVVKRLYAQRKDFEVYLVGKASKEIVDWVTDNQLKDSCIFFTGLLPYVEVANYVRKSDALIMFSRYENLPCVILEALVSGLPVISTDVGGIREVINKENGILLPSEDEEELLKAMNDMIDSVNKYDKQKISADAKNKFSYETVGRQFEEVYKEILSRKN